MPRQSINPDDAASIRKYRDEQMGFSARRQSGIPGSRGGSRPSSRAGSNLSLNSDDSPRGSNVRRSSSMRGQAARTSVLSQQNVVGFGSSSLIGILRYIKVYIKVYMLSKIYNSVKTGTIDDLFFFVSLEIFRYGVL